MGPEGFELTFAFIHVSKAEQIFEAAFGERIALHVEEEVTRIGLRHTREALAGNGCEQLVTVFARVPLYDLKPRLLAKPRERFRLHLRNACTGRQRGQFPHGLDADLLQLGDLDTSDVGDQTQMVDLFPFVGAALVPATIAAVTAGLAD